MLTDLGKPGKTGQGGWRTLRPVMRLSGRWVWCSLRSPHNALSLSQRREEGNTGPQGCACHSGDTGQSCLLSEQGSGLPPPPPRRAVPSLHRKRRHQRPQVLTPSVLPSDGKGGSLHCLSISFETVCCHGLLCELARTFHVCSVSEGSHLWERRVPPGP